MNNYIALTKILLKNSLSSFSSSKKGKINSRVKSAALGLLLLVSLLPLATAIGAAVWAAYPIFKSVGQEGLIFGSGLMMISMMILFFGIFYIMNVFYFSKDVESLLPLPLRPSTIMAAKFTVTLLYEYLTELLFLIPVIVAYGIASQGGVVYYLYSLIAFLTLPIIPLVYAGIINVVLMRFTNISRNRDQFRIIGGIIAMFAAIFANVKIQSLFNSFTNQEQVMEMLQGGNNSLLNVMTGLFPSNKLLAIALVNTGNTKGLVNLLLYLGISILFMVLFLTLGEALYFKGLVGNTETKSSRRKLTEKQMEKSTSANSAVKSYVLKELRLLFRTPIYFINCVLMNFIWPVFLFIPFLANSGDTQGFADFQSFLRTGISEGILLAVAFAAILFVSGSNAVTSTSISREGSMIFVNKYLPISYQDQILSKVLTGVILGCMGLLSMLIALVFLALPSLHLIILVVIVGVLAIFFTGFAGIFIDLTFPKLHWDNEQKAVKQNMNVVLHMLVAVVSAAAVVVPSIVLRLDLWIVAAGLIVIFGFADLVLYGLVKSAGVSLFEKIEP